MPRVIRDVPEPWATAMLNAGITDPRNDRRPSMNQLAQAAGVTTTTITSMVWGERETDQGTIDRVAEVLRVDPREVATWAGRTREDRQPYVPPSEASLMTADQRKLVDGVIRQFTAHAKAGTDDGHSTPLRPPLRVAAKRTRKGDTELSE